MTPGIDVGELVAQYQLDRFMELVAIFVGGLAGGLAGIRKGFDFFGVLVLAWIAALFGGVLRDVMIGALPPVGISDWTLLVAAVAGGAIVYFLYPKVASQQRAIIILDAFAMALFVWIGTMKGMDRGVGWVAAAMVGVLTGIGGGVVRDLLTGSLPLVLTDRQYYAIPACLGAIATVACYAQGWVGPIAATSVVAGVAGFRLLALKFHWAVPAPPPPT